MGDGAGEGGRPRPGRLGFILSVTDAAVGLGRAERGSDLFYSLLCAAG